MPTTQVLTESRPARPSSTVVLVREGREVPEVFMVKRHERSAFGSAYAFPGGVLEDADHNVHDHCVGLSSADANRVLAVDSGGLDYFSAAVRELFEESGVLLGCTQLSNDELDRARADLNAGALRWDDFVHANELLMTCDRLHYFSFRITPPELPKRYSARFFLAELPAGQQAVHCGGELTDSCWMSAQAILNASRNKTMRVHHPTRKTLERIAQFDSVVALSEWASSCAEQGVICDQPALAPEMLR